jgi:hypothetical protein
MGMFWLRIFLVYISGMLTPSFASKCDLFHGFWNKEMKWQVLGCNEPNGYNQWKQTLNLTVANGPIDVALFGDSNSMQLKDDVQGTYNLRCASPWANLHDTMHCTGDNINFLKVHVDSVFPYPSEVLNYCLEYAKRTKEQRTFFKTNEEGTTFYLQKYDELYHRSPSIIEFSINFWELARVREEAHCETGDVQVKAKALWESTVLPDDYLQQWTRKHEEILRSLKARYPHALIFTRVFHLPSWPVEAEAVRTHMKSNKMVSQLNDCIRTAAHRVEGIHVLDVERMTSLFPHQTDYLKDPFHCKPFINQELWNIIWYWHQKKTEKLQFDNR